LWAENDIRSTGRVDRSIGTLPVAWAASTCSSTPRSRHSPPRVAMSCTTPISLFTSITEASTVSGRSAAAKRSGSSRPLLSGAR
jgi:hypothetical protein